MILASVITYLQDFSVTLGLPEETESSMRAEACPCGCLSTTGPWGPGAQLGLSRDLLHNALYTTCPQGACPPLLRSPPLMRAPVLGMLLSQGPLAEGISEVLARSHQGLRTRAQPGLTRVSRQLAGNEGAPLSYHLIGMWHGRQKSSPSDAHTLILGTCDCFFKGTSQM